jgi:ATP-dependent RNA helicase SUPV3L1/SUV3
LTFHFLHSFEHLFTENAKTYQALQRLKSADIAEGGGLYCGPLRLLALEVYENLNRQGVFTNLMTGQEKREVPEATHTSCTVEMVNLDKMYDVAVIDEIQMIGNKERGYAWFVSCSIHCVFKFTV